jgi:hypothetical protein
MNIKVLVLLLANAFLFYGCKSQSLVDQSFNTWSIKQDFVLFQTYNFDKMSVTTEQKFEINTKDSTFYFEGKKVYLNPDTFAFMSNIDEFIDKNLEFIDDNVEWTFWVAFLVNEKGEISSLGIVRGKKDFSYLQAIKKLIHKMPNWSPAKKSNIGVASLISMPIKFKIP